MNSKYAGSLGNQRLIKEIKRMAHNITSSQIIDGTIGAQDLDTNLINAIAAQIGVFEITNTTANFFLVTMSDGNGNDVFTDVFVDAGTTEYIPYGLPANFITIVYELTTSNGIDSYTTSYPSHNGIINDSLAQDIISFNIQRSHQNYLQISIDP